MVTYTPAEVKQLCSDVKNGQPAQRSIALSEMAKSSTARPFHKEICDAIRYDSHMQVQTVAIRAAEQLALTSNNCDPFVAAITDTTRVLNEPNAAVRKHAIEVATTFIDLAYSKKDLYKLSKALNKALENDPNLSVRKTALESIHVVMMKNGQKSPFVTSTNAITFFSNAVNAATNDSDPVLSARAREIAKHHSIIYTPPGQNITQNNKANIAMPPLKDVSINFSTAANWPPELHKVDAAKRFEEKVAELIATSTSGTIELDGEMSGVIAKIQVPKGSTDRILTDMYNHHPTIAKSVTKIGKNLHADIPPLNEYDL